MVLASASSVWKNYEGNHGQAKVIRLQNHCEGKEDVWRGLADILIELERKTTFSKRWFAVLTII